MLKKFIRDVIIIVVGKHAEEIADLLHSKTFVNEFIIAKKLDITINQTRNILYKISDQGLVASIRKKDKRKGWYTYFWKIEVLKSLEFLRNILLRKIEQIENQIKNRETKQFYICERCNIEFNEENALLNDFTCNECGAIFVVRDNSKVLRELRRNLDKFKKELGLIDEEIRKEKEKLEKERLRELKKIDKEKAEVRKKAKASRLAKKKATDKKSSKKKPAKKAKKKTVKKKTKSKKKPTKKKVKKKVVKKKSKTKPKKIVKKVIKKKVAKPKKKISKNKIKKPSKKPKKVVKKKKK